MISALLGDSTSDQLFIGRCQAGARKFQICLGRLRRSYHHITGLYGDIVVFLKGFRSFCLRVWGSGQFLKPGEYKFLLAAPSGSLYSDDASELGVVSFLFRIGAHGAIQAIAVNCSGYVYREIFTALRPCARWALRRMALICIPASTS
jgi:hypothetical protein